MANGQQQKRRIPSLFSGAADDISGALEAMGESVVAELRDVRALLASMDQRLAQVREQGAPMWEEIPSDAAATSVYVSGISFSVRIRVTGVYVAQLPGGGGGTVEVDLGGRSILVGLADPFAGGNADSQWVPYEGVLEQGSAARFRSVFAGAPASSFRVYLKGWAD